MNTTKKSTFGGSLHLGRWLGIDVHIHVTFLLLLAFVGLSRGLAEGSAVAAWDGVIFFVGLFVCVLLHEYGHALAARRYGIGTRAITLLPIGGVAHLERMPERPGQELVVALAGPAVNVVIAAALSLGLWLGGHWQPGAIPSASGGSLLERLLAANVFLALFNLLPAFPMDGGRVLRSLLARRLESSRATRIAARIGQGMAVLFGFAGLLGNPMLLLIAVFVWIGAAQEAATAEVKSEFAGAAVRDAMLTDFRTLSPGDTLRDATRALLACSQQDFPVVEGGNVVGLLTRTDLTRALQEHGDHLAVAAFMRCEFAVLPADAPLDAVLSPENVEKGLTMPVVDGGRLVGLLTAENVGEYFMVRSALRRRDEAGRRPPRIEAGPSRTPRSLSARAGVLRAAGAGTGLGRQLGRA